MNAYRRILMAGLVTAAAVSAQAAEPHWSAGIGTGHFAAATRPASDSSEDSALRALRVPRVSAPHWTSLMGTGRATLDADQRSVDPSSSRRAPGQSIRAVTHWTAAIGTGRATDAPSATPPIAAAPMR